MSYIDNRTCDVGSLRFRRAIEQLRVYLAYQAAIRAAGSASKVRGEQ